MSKVLRIVGFLGLITIFCHIGMAAEIAYQVTDLGRGYWPNAINSSGEIVGHGPAPGGNTHAVLYKNGKWNDLGTLGGSRSNAIDINDHGDIVGDAETSNGSSHAFLYSKEDSIMSNLGTLGYEGSSANSINNYGEIVGQCFGTGEKSGIAFHYSNGTMGDISVPDAINSGANGINDFGKIVGASSTIKWVSHAVEFRLGSTYDLGSFGGTENYATAINNQGQIIGTSTSADGITHAFLLESGIMMRLGNANDSSYAHSLNNTGQVVGNLANYAFLYQGNEISNLNDLIDPYLNLKLWDALGINDRGQIIGVGTYKGDFYSHGFLLTPVPEPTSFALLVMGFLLMFIRFSLNQEHK